MTKPLVWYQIHVTPDSVYVDLLVVCSVQKYVGGFSVCGETLSTLMN